MTQDKCKFCMQLDGKHLAGCPNFKKTSQGRPIKDQPNSFYPLGFKSDDFMNYFEDILKGKK